MSANFSPTLGKVSPLKPFRAWVQMTLPQIYNDALSYQELVYKLLYYMNSLIESVEVCREDIEALKECYDKLEAYVNSYFDNLDVQEEINNKLDEMVEDGTLSGLINKYALIYSSGELNSVEVIKCETTDYCFQAMDMVSENTAVVMCSGIEDSYSSFVLFINTETYSEIDRIEVPVTAHGVFVTYYDGYVYFNGSGTGFYRVALTQGVFGTPEWIDTDTAVYRMGVCNGSLVGINDSSVFYVKDGTSIGDTICTYSTPDSNLLGRVAQSFVISDAFFGRTYSQPNCLAIYDYSGNYVKTVVFNETVSNVLYMGELEDICCYNGVYYGCSQLYYENHTYRFNIIFKVSLYNNYVLGRNHGYANNAIDIYVDSDNSNSFQDGTSDYPFSRLQDAIYFAEIRSNNNITAYVLNTTGDESLVVRGDVKINFRNDFQCNSLSVSNGIVTEVGKITFVHTDSSVSSYALSIGTGAKAVIQYIWIQGGDYSGVSYCINVTGMLFSEDIEAYDIDMSPIIYLQNGSFSAIRSQTTNVPVQRGTMGNAILRQCNLINNYYVSNVLLASKCAVGTFTIRTAPNGIGTLYLFEHLTLGSKFVYIPEKNAATNQGYVTFEGWTNAGVHNVDCFHYAFNSDGSVTLTLRSIVVDVEGNVTSTPYTDNDTAVAAGHYVNIHHALFI